MLLFLAEFLQQYYSGFSVFQYLTLRGILGVLTALAIALCLGPWMIRTLQVRQVGRKRMALMPVLQRWIVAQQHLHLRCSQTSLPPVPQLGLAEQLTCLLRQRKRPEALSMSLCLRTLAWLPLQRRRSWSGSAPGRTS